ncbi:inactive hydroxysteroid dehydrogenase-like protein 1 [Eriocheir sinensis]|uniref:inactive hydroxysteroid dehydrogenase-like protein 1 n=1 Tax=Eriocheir sinensis TaxID=95602 RepID=UPI0021CA2F0B|nr:inactive hydroxysteroid dehydrogenase-like protein 1 [Eriocheir sinensis]
MCPPLFSLYYVAHGTICGNEYKKSRTCGPLSNSGRVQLPDVAGAGGSNFWQLSAARRLGRMGCDALIPGLGDFEYVLTVVGLLSLIKFLAQFLWAVGDGVRTHFWSRLWRKRLVEDYGKWAVVTGSTDGIGKEYAKELAKRGMNVVLISRSMDKLQKVSTEIAQEFGVETEVVQADFMHGRPIYEDIAKHLQDKEIGILVNNVGVMLSHPMEFELASEKDIWSHVNVNVASVPAMSKLVLPGMLSRGKGAVVNVASIAGFHPIPLMGIYAASKAFVDYLSQAMEWEYRGSGIIMQTLTPAYVSTNMTKFSELVHKPGLLIPTASTYAASAINTLGYARRSAGYWPHGIQTYLVENYINSWMFMLGNHMWNSLLLRTMKKNQATSRG